MCLVRLHISRTLVELFLSTMRSVMTAIATMSPVQSAARRHTGRCSVVRTPSRLHEYVLYYTCTCGCSRDSHYWANMNTYSTECYALLTTQFWLKWTSILMKLCRLACSFEHIHTHVYITNVWYKARSAILLA